MLRDCIEFNIFYFSTADVLSEDTIIKWYKEAHSVKGKSVFLEQMSKFIEWLQNAEEGRLQNPDEKERGKGQTKGAKWRTRDKTEEETEEEE